MIRVHLTDGEIIACKGIARDRSVANLGCGVVDRRVTADKLHAIEEDGVIGEFAFCKHHNVFLNTDPTPRSGGFDCIVNNKRIDIKTTRFKNGRLTATLKKNPDIDYFVLGIYDPEAKTVDFIGYVSAERLYQDNNIRKLAPHLREGYVMDQEDLDEFKTTSVSRAA